MVKIDVLKKGFKNVCEVLEDNRSHLNELDAKIGDSDHGESVTKAFLEVDKVAEEFNSKDIGGLFKKIGMSLVTGAGAAMGPLYGTAFLQAGKNIEGTEELGYNELVKILESMARGIQKRGKASPGDKTMLDTIYPAVEAVKEKEELKPAIYSALKAAKEGMESTKDMEAKIGRASRLQERSIGYIDPGSMSMFLILEALLGTIVDNL